MSSDTVKETDYLHPYDEIIIKRDYDLVEYNQAIMIYLSDRNSAVVWGGPHGLHRYVVIRLI